MAREIIYCILAFAFVGAAVVLECCAAVIEQAPEAERPMTLDDAAESPDV